MPLPALIAWDPFKASEKQLKLDSDTCVLELHDSVYTHILIQDTNAVSYLFICVSLNYKTQYILIDPSRRLML